jgi:hypothetical protein
MNAKRAALAALVLTGACPAYAQRMSMDDLLAAMDANGDGALARSEAEAARARMFERLDRDSDGVLSQPERDATRSRGPSSGAQTITSGDVNGDGLVSRAEAMARPYRIFDRFDSNRDDVLSAAELGAIRALRPGG